MKTIWIVEDDYFQREEIRKAIENNFKSEVIGLSTEYEFINKLDNIEKKYPDLIIIDVMLPWTKPSRDRIEEPEEVKNNGFYRAGIRCEKFARTKQEIKNIPIIIYTNLHKDDLINDLDNLSEHTVFFGKSSDISDLIDIIKRFMQPSF